ncbi:MAG: DUF559 domain-containing protein [Gemmatimonadota bacterium]
MIDALAARQHGVVTRSQLLGAGIPAHSVDDRLRRCRMEGVFRGVYRVGPVRAPRWREMAAVLACGERRGLACGERRIPAPSGPVLSHGSAAAVGGIVRVASRPQAPVHVTIRGGYRSPGPWVKVHRTARLEPDEATSVDSIPFTTPARTLLDLAATLAPRTLERLVARAMREGLVGSDDLVRLLERYPRRAGAGVLRALLDRSGGPAYTRSEAETTFLHLIRRNGLPAPRVNVRVAGIEVDFHWPSTRLVVEIDGFRFHGSRAAFERDHRRDILLAEAGVRVLRFTWKQLAQEPGRVLVAVTRSLVEC